MDLEDVIARYAAMEIHDKKLPVTHLSSSACAVGDKRVSLSLVGKVLSSKPINKDAFISSMRSLWQMADDFTIEVLNLNQNLYVFSFRSDGDRRRILEEGPWTFDNCLIVLEKPGGLGRLSDLTLDRVSFWVQLHGLPLFFMNDESGRFLGSLIGRVERIDKGVSKECIGKFIRVKVNINISEPLKPALRVKVDGTDDVVTVLLRYERLPDFCFGCGRFGHPKRECPSKSDGDSLFEGLFYSDLIRAGPPSRFSSRTHKQIRGSSERVAKVSLKDVPKPIYQWRKKNGNNSGNRADILKDEVDAKGDNSESHEQFSHGMGKEPVEGSKGMMDKPFRFSHSQPSNLSTRASATSKAAAPTTIDVALQSLNVQDLACPNRRYSDAGLIVSANSDPVLQQPKVIPSQNSFKWGQCGSSPAPQQQSSVFIREIEQADFVIGPDPSLLPKSKWIMR